MHSLAKRFSKRNRQRLALSILITEEWIDPGLEGKHEGEMTFNKGWGRCSHVVYYLGFAFSFRLRPSRYDATGPTPLFEIRQDRTTQQVGKAVGLQILCCSAEVCHPLKPPLGGITHLIL